jgi:hypothetical protein
MAGDGLVPGEATIWGDLGRADADYTAWRVLGDGQTVDVTPRTGDPALTLPALAAGTGASTGSVNPAVATLPGASSFKLIIERDSVDVSDVVITNVVVGEQVLLRAALRAAGPDYGAQPPPITNYAWTASGKAFDSYYCGPAMGKVYWDLQNNQSSFVATWADGGLQSSWCFATVKGIVLRERTYFDIMRPQVEFTASVTGSIGVGTNYYPGVPIACLYFGEWHSTPGMTFRWQSSSNSPPGQYECIQLAQMHSEVAAAGTNYIGSGHGIDLNPATGNPFYSKTYSNGWWHAVDSPVLPLLGSVTNAACSDSFTTFIMFKPSGVRNPQFVPVIKVSWSWSAEALTNSATGQWELRSSAYPDTPTPLDTTDHPEWDSKALPLNWTPNKPPGYAQ